MTCTNKSFILATGESDFTVQFAIRGKCDFVCMMHYCVWWESKVGMELLEIQDPPLMVGCQKKDSEVVLSTENSN